MLWYVSFWFFNIKIQSSAVRTNHVSSSALAFEIFYNPIYFVAVFLSVVVRSGFVLTAFYFFKPFVSLSSLWATPLYPFLMAGLIRLMDYTLSMPCWSRCRNSGPTCKRNKVQDAPAVDWCSFLTIDYPMKVYLMEVGRQKRSPQQRNLVKLNSLVVFLFISCLVSLQLRTYLSSKHAAWRIGKMASNTGASVSFLSLQWKRGRKLAGTSGGRNYTRLNGVTLL